MSFPTKPTRRTVLAGAAATTVFSAAAGAMPLSRLRGHPRISALGGKIVSFAIDNTVAAPSLGHIRIGLAFKPGDMPAGHRPRIQVGASVVAAQYNALSVSTWSDGSVRFCIADLMQSDFTASETRNYDVYAEIGAFDNSSAVNLTSITGAHDFTIVFTNVVGSTSGALPDHTASLNTHAATATRVTRYEAGPYCNSWEVWGMASASGVDHAHLKTTCFVSEWRNAVGTVIGCDVEFAVQQDWWSVAGKEKLTYDATLYDGSTVIETYPAVEHPYMMHWLTVRLDDDDQHAQPHWIAASDRPTLLYRPDQSYLIAAGLAPPLNLSTAYSMPNYPDTYVPGSAQGHRASLPDEGAYAGRGVWSNMECIAFCVPTPENRRIMRTSSFAAAHIPMHRRSNNTRTRPGESADVANTMPALILWDSRSSSTPSDYYDFSADGMPAPVHAYSDSRTPTAYKDSYVAPTGGMVSGTTNWVTPDNLAHFPSMCHLIYLLEGRRYFLKALLDIAAHATQCLVGSNAGGMPSINGWEIFSTPPAAIFPGATATQWAGVGLRNVSEGATRAIAWPIIMMRHALCVIGDAETEANYLRQYVTNNGKYIKACLDLYPSNSPGIWGPGTGGVGAWMDTWIGVHCYFMYDLTGDTNWKAVAEYLLKLPVFWGANNMVGGCSIYHMIGKPSGQSDWSVSNDWFPGGIYTITGGAAISASTDTITCNGGAYAYTNGDKVVPCDIADSQFIATAIPAELTLGQVYYIVNANGAASFQLSETLGGPPIDFTSNYTGKVFGFQKQSYQHLLTMAADGYMPILRTLVVMGRRHGHPSVTDTIMNYFNSELVRAGVDPRAWATWNYSESI